MKKTEQGSIVSPSYVYIFANQRNGSLYVGSTRNLIKRIWEHKIISFLALPPNITCICWFIMKRTNHISMPLAGKNVSKIGNGVVCMKKFAMIKPSGYRGQVAARRQRVLNLIVAARFTGASLLELLISLILVSIMLVGLSHQYLSVKRHSLHLEKRITTDYDLLILDNLLRQRIRRAGFTPCASIDALITPTPQQFKSVVPLSQGLQLVSMDNHFSTADIQLATHQLQLKSSLFLKVGQKVLIADCLHAELGQIKFIEGKKITLEKKLFYNYVPPIYIGEWLIESFVIKKNRQGRPALFYQRDKTEELTESIRDFSAVIERKHPKLVTVKLQVKPDESINITTKVRAS